MALAFLSARSAQGDHAILFKRLMEIFMKSLILVLAFLFSSVALAEGGKNREANPVIVDEGCVVLIPEMVNLKNCLDESANTFEGYSCEIIVNVLCPADE